MMGIRTIGWLIIGGVALLLFVGAVALLGAFLYGMARRAGVDRRSRPETPAELDTPAGVDSDAGAVPGAGTGAGTGITSGTGIDTRVGVENPAENPIKVLNRRYAQGEITQEEYDGLRQELEEAARRRASQSDETV